MPARAGARIIRGTGRPSEACAKNTGGATIDPCGRNGTDCAFRLSSPLPCRSSLSMILDEAWRDLDRMAAALDQRASELSADSAERAVLELVTGGKACPRFPTCVG
jgi:hypothetical protein